MVFGLGLALPLTAILLVDMVFRLYLSLPLIAMLLFILNGSLRWQRSLLLLSALAHGILVLFLPVFVPSLVSGLQG